MKAIVLFYYWFRFGRGNFQESTKLTKRGNTTDAQSQIDWSKFKYMVFDIPNHSGTYAERYQQLGNSFIFLPSSTFFIISSNNSIGVVNRFGDESCKYVHVAGKEECIDFAHLEKFFQDILDKGGEGIILRDPEALYTPGRSPGYLKHKVLYCCPWWWV